MRKFLLGLSLSIVICLVGAGQCMSQRTMRHGSVEQGIQFQGFSEEPGLLLVDFEIPYGGVVEFSLYNAAGERVWHKQAPLEEGPNRYAMRRAAFHAGENYTFSLRYKLSEVRGTVPAQP